MKQNFCNRGVLRIWLLSRIIAHATYLPVVSSHGNTVVSGYTYRDMKTPFGTQYKQVFDKRATNVEQRKI